MFVMNGLFVGEGTLLVQCAEAFRRAGGEITGILSHEPRVRAWAGLSFAPIVSRIAVAPRRAKANLLIEGRFCPF
mgnify:CR=1 FL=1